MLFVCKNLVVLISFRIFNLFIIASSWLNGNQERRCLLLFFNECTFLKGCYHLSFLSYYWCLRLLMEFVQFLKNLISFFMENHFQKNCPVFAYDWYFQNLKSLVKFIIIIFQCFKNLFVIL